jgi:hypothetical protein
MPQVTVGVIAAALDVGERRVIRIDVTDACATLNRHVAHRHAFVDGHAVHGGPAVFIRIAHAAVHAEAANDREDHVLRVHPGAELAVDVNAPYLQRVEREALRREDVADLRGTDAKGDGAKSAVRGRMAVAARDRHPRLRQAQLGADDVHDALVLAARRTRSVELDAEFAAVALEHARHFLGSEVDERPLLDAGRHDVIDRGKGA